MKKILFIGILLFSTINSFSQVNSSNEINSKPYIEVVGTAQKEVIPDRIYISILLTETTENSQDFSIQIQEEKLKKIVVANNIDSKNLFLSSAISEVTVNKKNETSIKLTREFTLILKNADEVTKIFRELTDINIKAITVKKTEYSEIESVRKEVREKAIKAAKEKAEYLLSAIGEQISKPLEIKEVEDKSFKGGSHNTTIASENENTQTSFEKIVIKFSYFIKYSIK
ncbi:MAG TPA: SIMPL domain-containing protein [Flavobacterium sp.]